MTGNTTNSGLAGAGRKCVTRGLAMLLVFAGPVWAAEDATERFQAGAYAQDITPDWFPIVVNGGFQPRYAERALDPLHARCLVLDDGQHTLALVIVDSCVLDRPLLDRAKELARERTGIPVERMFISVTHTHSAPAAVGALGTDPDPRYREWLPEQIARGIAQAYENLEPAEVGWAVESLPHVVHSRRWIARPDRIGLDPFGERTTRATMHPGYRNPDWQEPSGPMNPEVTVLAVRRPGGSPLALLGSFSIHYVGTGVLSADYFGVFANRIGAKLGVEPPDPSFVGILANGVSGDAYLRDYTAETRCEFDVNSVAEEVAEAAARAYASIDWQPWLRLDMRETELELDVRPPRLEWGRQVMQQLAAEGRGPESRDEFYAREQVLLAEMPSTRQLKLQTLRIGSLGLVGIPCEVFAITGLRIADRSPFEHTFTVMLSNGWDGYLPPPEQMAMGGYTTWLARSSCLEDQAEPKVIERVVAMLADLAGEYRAARPPQPLPAYPAAVLASQPRVYWRLADWSGPYAENAVDGQPLGTFETQIAYGMPGPQAPEFPGFESDNRAPHFVGQRLQAQLPDLGDEYSVTMWVYNCLPHDARSVTGYLFSRASDGQASGPAEHLAIGGHAHAPGTLQFHQGADFADAHHGVQQIPLRNWVPQESWYHVALVRHGRQVALFVNGQPEFEGFAPTEAAAAGERIVIGGRADGQSGFEGRIDEVALFSRALPAEEILAHYHAACALLEKKP